jgi:hypothetical protein
VCVCVCVCVQFHNAYFSGKILYWLNQVDKSIDNCDQRMTVEYVSARALCCSRRGPFDCLLSQWRLVRPSCAGHALLFTRGVSDPRPLPCCQFGGLHKNCGRAVVFKLRNRWIDVDGAVCDSHVHLHVCEGVLAVCRRPRCSKWSLCRLCPLRSQLIGGASIGIAFAYFVVVMFLTLVLNSRVARSTFRVNEGEGFFRFRHARIKEFAECGESGSLAALAVLLHAPVGAVHASITCPPARRVTRVVVMNVAVTLYDGQRAERALSQSAFDVLYWRMRQLFRVSLHQNILTNVQNQLSQPLAQLIIAVTIISSHSLNGKAVTQQSSQVSLNALVGFLSSFCMVPPLYAIFGSLAGITHRVGQLMEALEELRVRRAAGVCARHCWAQQWSYVRFAWCRVWCWCRCHAEHQIASVRLQSRTAVEESSAIGVTNLCCRTPDGNILFQNMSFMVSPGSSLLIMGPSGCGKSSLLRIIAGLWPVDDGIVFRPLTIGEGGIFFVPQRPYIPQVPFAAAPWRLSAVSSAVACDAAVPIVM